MPALRRAWLWAALATALAVGMPGIAGQGGSAVASDAAPAGMHWVRSQRAGLELPLPERWVPTGTRAAAGEVDLALGTVDEETPAIEQTRFAIRLADLSEVPSPAEATRGYRSQGIELSGADRVRTRAGAGLLVRYVRTDPKRPVWVTTLLVPCRRGVATLTLARASTESPDVLRAAVRYLRPLR